ncbi:MAG: hypothetical protein ACYC6L_00470 [Anaerolineae bacterium]
MEIPLKAEVQCRDGVFGHSVCVIIDPLKEQVTHLVVGESGFRLAEYLVPINLVQETTSTTIKLSSTCEEIRLLEPFLEAEFIPNPEDGTYYWPYFETMNPGMIVVQNEQIPKDELAIRRGDNVHAKDGVIGQVDAFIIDPHTDSVTHLVMREGHLWGKRDVTVPVAEIERFANDTVYLKLTKEEVGKLPVVPVKK